MLEDRELCFVNYAFEPAHAQTLTSRLFYIIIVEDKSVLRWLSLLISGLFISPRFAAIFNITLVIVYPYKIPIY